MTGKPSSVTLGTYPELGLAAARKARDEQAALVGRGLDPVHERRRSAVVSELTLENAARSWDTSRAGTGDTGTRATAMRRLALHVFPLLGPRAVASIRPADVTTVLDAIVASGQRETANRTCTVLGQVFEWAQAREHVTTNPANVVKHAYRTDQRALLRRRPLKQVSRYSITAISHNPLIRQRRHGALGPRNAKISFSPAPRRPCESLPRACACRKST